MDSIWKADGQMPCFPRLEGDLDVDVLVVGGGLSGLLCGRKLALCGTRCVLIEQGRILEGVSGRTTAKLTAQHGLVYGKLLKTFGADRARMYWLANQDGVEDLAALAEEADCDFRRADNFLYTVNEPEKLEAEMRAYETLKIPARWEDSLPLPFDIGGAVGFSNQGQFHPLKLGAYIAKDLEIYENTKALEFIGNRVVTPNGTITAKKIIVATHFPLLNKHGAYFLKLYQQRSYVVALENGPKLEGMYLDIAENGLSLRSAGDWLLLGGGGHRTGKQGLGWRLPEQAAKEYYPEGRIAARWATQDCMTLDGIPYIGQYSKATPDLFVATGFQKWGMSSAMVAADILSDLVREKESPYASLFSPSRSILHKQLLCNGVETTVNLLRPRGPRCPHLGCALHWNREERSWDCSCHGSRFDETGRVLNNPATEDMKKPPSPQE